MPPSRRTQQYLRRVLVVGMAALLTGELANELAERSSHFPFAPRLVRRSIHAQLVSSVYEKISFE